MTESDQAGLAANWNSNSISLNATTRRPLDPVDDRPDIGDLATARKEIAWLRKEVADLRERLAIVMAQTDELPPHRTKNHPWLRIAATVATTFILGKLVQRLRLGASGAAAVPMSR